MRLRVRLLPLSAVSAFTLLLLASACIVLLVSACGGGHRRVFPRPIPPAEGGGGQPPAEPDPQQALEDYLRQQAEKLPPATTPSYGSIKGTLSVEGYTVLDPVSLDPVLPGTSPLPVPVRVVDPEDDVDKVVYPDAGGGFVIPNLPPLETATLSVNLTVAEDVDGDRSGGDAIECSLPVQVVAAKQTTVYITIAPLPTEGQSDLPPELDYLQVPAPIHFSYVYTGPDGSRTRDFAIVGPLQRMWMDADGDGQFTAADLAFTDENANGIDDAAEEQLSGATGPPAGEGVIAGWIEAVARDTVTLQVGGGTTTVGFTGATTVVDEYGAQIALTRHLVGREAVAAVRWYPDGRSVATHLMVFLNPGQQRSGSNWSS